MIITANSTLVSLFTSLANKIRSKLGTSGKYTPAEAISAIDAVYTKGVTDTKKGDAKASDVLYPKTFTSTNGVGLTGSIQIESTSVTPTTSSQTITPSSGNLLNSVIVGAIQTQTTTTTAGTSAKTVTPSAGKYFSSVTVNPTPSQTKSASPTTSAQTISPDSGKLLSSVSISAIRTQEKTATSSRTAQTVSNDAGYFMTKVTINKYPDATGTFTTSSSSSAVDMGATNNYRYVNTTGVYSAGVHYGTDVFLQNLARNAFWFSINNSCGGNVTTTTVSGQNQVTINSINSGIIVVTNRNTGQFLNLILKYNTYWRSIDSDAGSTQNSGLTYVDSSQSGKIVLRTASGIDNFFNVWIFNTY